MIREASFDDLPALTVTLEKFHAASPYAGFIPIDYPTGGENLERLIGSDDAACMVAESDGVIVGAVGAAIGSLLWFNGSIRIGVELFWWLEPEFRTGSTGLRLLDAIEESVRARGAAGMVLLELVNSPASVGIAYARRGYRQMEKLHMRLF